MNATSSDMESKKQRQQLFPRWEGEATSQWGANMRTIQDRIKDRFRVAIASHRLLRQKSQRPGAVGVGGSRVWRATATGLVVARVFQGNIVLARVARSMAKQEWQKRVVWISSLKPSSVVPTSIAPKFWSLLGLSAAGKTLACTEEPAQAEALMLPPPVGSSYGSGSEDASSLRHKARSEKLIYYEDKAIAQASEDSVVSRLLQAVVLPTVANACHAFMHGLNITEVYGADKLEEAILHRPNGQSLITVCNHVASMDDPLVMAALLPPRMLLQAGSLRWTLCATDRCFTNAAFSAFFNSVKVLPLKRGAGLQQEGLDIALSKLEKGDWVHIFPEGSRSRDGGRTIGPVKRGVGRLVLDVDKTPLVIPFVHSGMQELMPIGSKIPSICKKVTVLVGDPIELDDLVKQHVEVGFSKTALYDAIALRVGQKMQGLKEELDQLVLKQSLQGEVEVRPYAVKRAQRLLQYVDWEGQGVLLEDDATMEERRPCMLTIAPMGQHKVDNSELAAVESEALLLERDTDTEALSEADLTEQKTLEAGMTESLDLDEDWDGMISAAPGGIVARLQGFDPPSFLGLGFAAQGFFRSRREQVEGRNQNGRRYWQRLSVGSLKELDL